MVMDPRKTDERWKAIQLSSSACVNFGGQRDWAMIMVTSIWILNYNGCLYFISRGADDAHLAAGLFLRVITHFPL